MAGKFWPDVERKDAIASPFQMSAKDRAPARLARLHISADIECVKRRGKRIQTDLFNLVFCQSPTDSVRVSVIVGRRLGKAVERNTAKRIFRELARQSSRDFVETVDMLIFPKRTVLTEPRQKVRDCWTLTLRKIGLLPSADLT